MFYALIDQDTRIVHASKVPYGNYRCIYCQEPVTKAVHSKYGTCFFRHAKYSGNYCPERAKRVKNKITDNIENFFYFNGVSWEFIPRGQKRRKLEYDFLVDIFNKLKIKYSCLADIDYEQFFVKNNSNFEEFTNQGLPLNTRDCLTKNKIKPLDVSRYLFSLGVSKPEKLAPKSIEDLDDSLVSEKLEKDLTTFDYCTIKRLKNFLNIVLSHVMMSNYNDTDLKIEESVYRYLINKLFFALRYAFVLSEDNFNRLLYMSSYYYSSNLSLLCLTTNSILNVKVICDKNGIPLRNVFNGFCLEKHASNVKIIKDLQYLPTYKSNVFLDSIVDTCSSDTFIAASYYFINKPDIPFEFVLMDKWDSSYFMATYFLLKLLSLEFVDPVLTNINVQNK